MIRREYFTIPVYCRYISEITKKSILNMQKDLSTTQVDEERNELKLSKLFKEIADYKEEMMYEQTV